MSSDPAGLWYDPDEGGWGLGMTQQGDTWRDTRAGARSSTPPARSTGRQSRPVPAQVFGITHNDWSMGAGYARHIGGVRFP